jgi:F-type H+-transporting ATPase subunit delta
MSDFKIASRYAKALFDLAAEKGNVEAVAENVRNLHAISEENADFRLLLNSPLFGKNQKNEALKKMFSSFDASMLLLFNLMVEKNRESLIPMVAVEFTNIYNRANGIIYAEVESATELDNDTMSNITAFVKAHTGAKQVNIKQKTDKNLIGGLTIFFEGKFYNSSVLGQINKMKKELNIA